MTETAEAGYPQGNPQEEKESANTSRLALVLSFIKFMVGTVATGVATLIVSTQYHNAQLALEEKKSTAELVLAEKKADAAIRLEEKKNEHTMSLQDRVAEVEYLGKFLTQAMDDDIKHRIHLAEYMTAAALTPHLRDIWSNYKKQLIAQQEALEKEKNKTDVEVTAKEREVGKKIAAIPIEKRVEENETILEYARDLQLMKKQLYTLQDQLDRQQYGSLKENYVDFPDMLQKAETARINRQYDVQRDLLLKARDRAPDALQPYILTSLSTAYRALHDFTNGRIVMEKAVALGPKSMSALFQLAIMQKNDGQIDSALKSLDEAESMAGSRLPDIELVIAGYLIHAGKRDEGIRRFNAIKDQLVPRERFTVNLAWYYAVADQKEDFYKELEFALDRSRQQTLWWIDQEVDIKKYSDEERFKKLLAKYGSAKT